MSGGRRRILAIIDTIQVSGPGRQLAATVDGLGLVGHELRILVFARQGADIRPYQTFLEARGIAHSVITERSSFDVATIRKVAAEIERFSPDVVQTHGYKPSAVAFALRATGTRFPWVAFCHGATTENLKVRAYHMLDQLLMRTADVVIVMSMGHLRRMTARGRDVRLVHNAVLFPLEGEQLAARDDGSPSRILVVGRLSSEKGVDVLLNACAMLVARGVCFHLDIVGDGPDRGSLESMTARNALSAVVTFHGHQSDPKPFYRSADLLVIPSRSEGLPNVLLEAIAHGLPVVSTRVGAVPEVLTDESVGLLCAIGDPEGLASVIGRASAPSYRDSGRPGRQRVLEEFSLERRCQRLAALYNEVGRGTRSGANDDLGATRAS